MDGNAPVVIEIRRLLGGYEDDTKRILTVTVPVSAVYDGQFHKLSFLELVLAINLRSTGRIIKLN